MTILNQWSRKNCGVFATMGIMQHKWIIFDIARFKDEFAPYINQIEKLFVASGYIDKFITINTATVVDMWLKKWEYLLTSSARGNFSNPPNITFDWKTQHFFIICEDLWNRWKCQNSWGKEWGEGGFFYINKSDFNYLMRPRRVIIKDRSSISQIG